MAGNFYKYHGRSPLTDNASVRWDELSTTAARGGENALYVDNYLSAGDYSTNDGGLVRANVNAFTEQFDSTQSSLWWSIRGGHGAFGVAVLADVLDEDSALYSSEDEALVDAANAIRETIEALEETPYIDEEAHSRLEMELQEGQFPQAMMDVYVSPNRATGDEGYTTSFPLMILSAIEDDLEPEDVLKFVDADGDAVEYPVEGFRAFYYEAGGNLFSVYPETEGSGDNVTVLFRFDHFVRDFERAYTGVKAISPKAAEVLAHRLVEALFSDDYKAFSYQSPIYNTLREGQRIARLSADERAVLHDATVEAPDMTASLIEKGKLLDTVQKQGELGGLRKKR